MYNIVTSSPKVLKRVVESDIKEELIPSLHHRKKYPFEMLLPGQSFVIPIDEVKPASLRTIVSRRNQRSEKQFVVVTHKEFNCFEVGRIK